MASISMSKLDLSFLGDKSRKAQKGSYRWSSKAQRFVTHAEWHRLHPSERKASALPAPMVINDSVGGGLDGIKSMADGQTYTSRRAYERGLARHGCEVVGFDKNWTSHVEKANQYNEKAHEADIVADIKKSIEQVSSL